MVTMFDRLKISFAASGNQEEVEKFISYLIQKLRPSVLALSDS